MRYVDTSNFRAPYDNVDFQGLGQYPTRTNLHQPFRGRALYPPGVIPVAGMGILGSAGLGVLGAEIPDAGPACTFAFGSQAEGIKKLQVALNVYLERFGYEPVPVTGVWDAQTCGALEFVMASLAVTSPAGVPPGLVAQMMGIDITACPKGIDLGKCVEKIPPTKKGGGGTVPGTTQAGMGALPWVIGGALVVGLGLIWIGSRPSRRSSSRTTRRRAA
jgi:hypothetical protein